MAKSMTPHTQEAQRTPNKENCQWTSCQIDENQ